MTLLALLLLLGAPEPAPAEGAGDAPLARAQISHAQISRAPGGFVEGSEGPGSPAPFVLREGGLGLFVTAEGFVLAAPAAETSGFPSTAALRLVVEGASSEAAPRGIEPRPWREHRFLGAAPDRWRTELPVWGAVRVEGVRPGTDLEIHGRQGILEYDLLLAPGADLASLSLRLEGAESLSIDADGSLRIESPSGALLQSPPRAWVETEGAPRRAVPVRFQLLGADRFGFETSGDARDGLLRIDPQLEYGTYIGGQNNDFGEAIAVDAAGSAYVAGNMAYPGFPTTFLPVSWLGGTFVAKLTPNGSTLVYSAVLVHSVSADIALGPAGDAVVAGIGELGYPVTLGAFNPSASGPNLGFVPTPTLARIAPSGAALLYSTFLGGWAFTGGVVVDPFGNAYACGSARDTMVFPTTPGAYKSTATNWDAFVTKLAPNGGSLVYSTLLGGPVLPGMRDTAWAIALDDQGSAYVTGTTGDPTFPVTPGALQTVFPNGGAEDGFVTKLDATGSSLVYSTFLGSSLDYIFDEGGRAITVDAQGCAYVAGWAGGPGFPVTAGAFDTTYGGTLHDGFVAKLDASGSSLLYATFIGGGGYDELNDLAIDEQGVAWVTGATQSSSTFPVTQGSFLPLPPGGTIDGFLAAVHPDGGSLLYGSFVGGAADTTERANGIALAPGGSIYVTGYTNSSFFPTTPGSFSPSDPSPSPGFGGKTDAFVVKLRPSIAPWPFGAGTAGCTGPQALQASGFATIGAPAFRLHCTAAPQSSLGLLLVGDAKDLAGSDPFGLGLLLHVDLLASTELLAFDLASDALGKGSLLVPIPADAALVGRTYFAQCVWIWPASCSARLPFGLSSSNGLAIPILGP